LSKSSRTKKVLNAKEITSVEKTNSVITSKDEKICIPLPKVETQRVCVNLPKIEVETQKVCFNLPKIPTKGCDCPPPQMRCRPRKEKVIARAVIPKSEIASSIGGPLTIAEIEIGEISIPSLRLKDFSGTFKYDSCKAKNVELEITLSIKTTFSGNIDLPWPLCWEDFCYGVSGGVNFASYVEKHTLGDVLFGAGQFTMFSPTTNIGPFEMTAEPIRKTEIDQVTADNIQMQCTSIPIDTPFGINIGICLPIPNPTEPTDIATDQTSIDEMASSGISSPQASMKDIKALNITIPSVTTQAFEAQSNTALTISTSKKMYGSGVTLIGDADKAHITGVLTLNITKMIMRVRGGLEFSNLSGTVTTNSAIADKLDLSLVLKGIKIKGLNLCGMKIPEIEVVM
jgi:hypothetical protein